MQIEINDETFDKAIENSKIVPVVVYFWSPRNEHCNTISQALEKLARKYEKKFILARLNVDENKKKAIEQTIAGTPCVKMFKNGKEVSGFIGELPEEGVKEWLEKNLSKNN